MNSGAGENSQMKTEAEAIKGAPEQVEKALEQAALEILRIKTSYPTPDESVKLIADLLRQRERRVLDSAIACVQGYHDYAASGPTGDWRNAVTDTTKRILEELRAKAKEIGHAG